MKLSSVAGDSDDAVNKATEEAAALRREEGGPVVLRYRDNQPVLEPATPPKPVQPANPTPAPSGGLIEPLPDNQQPPASQPGGTQPPAAQPNNGQPAAQPPQGAPANSNGGLLMPLPDNQQPPAPQDQSQPTNPQQPQQQRNRSRRLRSRRRRRQRKTISRQTLTAAC